MVYAPGTTETDPKKQNRAIQAAAAAVATNTTDIATANTNISTANTNIAANTAAIATANTNIAANTSNITALQSQTSGYESAWTAYTPTIASGTGSFTTVAGSGRFKQNGKTVFLEITITITTNGTAATFITATLPSGLSCKADTFFGGKARAVSGKLVGAAVQATGSTMAIGNYDNTYPGANGEVINISGVFEAS